MKVFSADSYSVGEFKVNLVGGESKSEPARSKK